MVGVSYDCYFFHLLVSSLFFCLFFVGCWLLSVVVGQNSKQAIEVIEHHVCRSLVLRFVPPGRARSVWHLLVEAVNVPLSRTPRALCSPKRYALNACEMRVLAAKLLLPQKPLVTPRTVGSNMSPEWILGCVFLDVIVVVIVARLAKDAVVCGEDVTQWRGCRCWSGCNRRRLTAVVRPPPACHGRRAAPGVVFVRRFVRVAETLARATPVIQINSSLETNRLERFRNNPIQT